MPFYKPKLKYTEEAVIKAIKAVENGSTFRAASKKFNIPDSTLRDKYYGRSPMETTEDCRTSIPTVEKEKMIAERVRTMMQDGFPVSRQQLLAIACDTLNTPSTKRCTKDNYAPNMKWIAGFLQRHPEISDLAVENIAFLIQILVFFKMEYSQAVSERNIFEVDGNVVIEVVDDDDKTIASRSSTLRSCVRRESSRSVITWTSPPISLGGEDNLKRVSIILQKGLSISKQLLTIGATTISNTMGVNQSFPNSHVLNTIWLTNFLLSHPEISDKLAY
ncbi:hypothetical protein J6590_009340 [Homalodisca vitripennis]|nr:hypothetical protein J6590_009340 [Homalodisca vitripennis]